MEQNNYCLTLTHHGIKGMKWGIRRTAAQLGHKVFKKKQKPKKEDDEKKSPKPARKKTMREMTDDELRAAIKRAELERDYARLRPQTSSKGKRFINAIWNDMVYPAAKDAGKSILTDKFKQLGKQYLGIEDDSETAFQKLKKRAEESTAKRTIATNDDWFKAREADAKAAEDKAKANKADTDTSTKADKTKTNTAKTDKKETYETTYEAPKKSNNSDGSSASSSKKSRTTFYDADFVDKTEYASTRSSGSSFVSGLLSSGSSNRNTSSTGSTALISAGHSYISGLLAAPDDNR